MVDTCPHCQQALRFNDAQRDKLNLALAQLKPGQVLKIACPHCQVPIEFSRGAEPAKAAGGPPPPPTLDWLSSGDVSDEDIIEDAARTLILVPDQSMREAVAAAYAEAGYRPEFAPSAEAAMESLRFTPYASVLLHSRFEGDGGLEASTFHRYMCNMPMSKRRPILYVLLGPEFHTLYDMQALANSANLVVNEKELGTIDIVLKKGFADQEKLFAPLNSTLREERLH